MRENISIIGGDLRCVRLADILTNNNVFVYGQEKYKRDESKIKNCDTLEECIKNSKVIVSGMPLTKDKITVNCPYSDRSIRLDEIYKMIKNKIFIAGGIPSWFYEEKSIENIELLNIEELTILNAIPTVEGAIKIAIEEMEETIHESNVMVYGYGRIGKILCKRFQDLGANVYCVARKETDLAWIREGRYIPVRYNEVEKYVKTIKLIVNTVPELVIKEDTISNLDKTCVIIDLASSPGGVDKNSAEKYGIKNITALGIPGKIAPLSAAKYIKNIIEKRLKNGR